MLWHTAIPYHIHKLESKMSFFSTLKTVIAMPAIPLPPALISVTYHGQGVATVSEWNRNIWLVRNLWILITSARQPLTFLAREGADLAWQTSCKIYRMIISNILNQAQRLRPQLQTKLHCWHYLNTSMCHPPEEIVQNHVYQAIFFFSSHKRLRETLLTRTKTEGSRGLEIKLLT